MTSITIEGSNSPSTFLARGEQRTVQHTDRIQRLIDGGFVTVVENADSAPPKRKRTKAEPEPTVDLEVQPDPADETTVEPDPAPETEGDVS